jgi:hypothetical protein
MDRAVQITARFVKNTRKNLNQTAVSQEERLIALVTQLLQAPR